MCLLTLQEKNCHWNLTFANSLMANSLKLNSADHQIFQNISMIAYIIGIQKSKFANIWVHELDHSEADHYVKFCEYFHPVGYVNAPPQCNVCSFQVLFILCTHNIVCYLTRNVKANHHCVYQFQMIVHFEFFPFATLVCRTRFWGHFHIMLFLSTIRNGDLFSFPKTIPIVGLELSTQDHRPVWFSGVYEL